MPTENPLTGTFVPAAFMLAMATLTGVGMLVLSWLLGGGRSSRADETVYECGVDPLDRSDKRFRVSFYIVAILFILFDVEVAMMVPWGVFLGQPRGEEAAAALGFDSVQSLRLFAAAEGLFFIALLGVGFVYLYKSGALDSASGREGRVGRTPASGRGADERAA